MIGRALIGFAVVSVVVLGMQEGSSERGGEAWKARSGILMEIDGRDGGRPPHRLRPMTYGEEGYDTHGRGYESIISGIEGERERTARGGGDIGRIFSVEEVPKRDYLEGLLNNQVGILDIFYIPERRLRFREPIMISIEE